MNFFKRLYFDLLSTIIRIVAIGTSWIHGPWTRKKSSQDDVVAIKEVVKTGDIILTHTRGEFTTLTIPGYWKHVEIYDGNGKTIGAVAPKVRKTWLENVIHKTDYWCILRTKDHTTEDEMLIVTKAETFIGKYYDMRMNFNKPDRVSCSELYYHVINSIRPNYLELRKRLGFDTVTPQDIYNAKSKFDIILEKRG